MFLPFGIWVNSYPTKHTKTYENPLIFHEIQSNPPVFRSNSYFIPNSYLFGTNVEDLKTHQRESNLIQESKERFFFHLSQFQSQNEI